MKRPGVVNQPWLSVVCGVAAVLVVLALCTCAEAKEFDVMEYIAKGYSSIGPIQVLSVEAKSLTITLYSQPKNITVGLQGRSLTVRDLAGSKLALADLKNGTRVYVLQKANEVLIVVLPAKEVRNDI
jgi:hypothetical protein